MSSPSKSPETVELTLRLPSWMVQHIQDQVATGVYASESDFIESLLLSEELFQPVDQDELTQWINTEGVRRLHAMEADPGCALSVEEVFDFLEVQPADTKAA